jgi:hypothetical protein
LDLSGYATLDFRVDRETPTRAPNANPSGPTNFHVQLVRGDGSLSQAVAASNWIELVGPFGTPDADLTPPATFPDGYHLNMPTARIPMRAFGPEDLNQIRGIRLTFDDTATGKIYVTNFRASRHGIRSIEGGEGPGAEIAVLDKPTFSGSPRVIEQGNVIENVQFVPAVDFGTSITSGGTVRFDMWSETVVPVGDEIPVMLIGSAQCDGTYLDASTQRMMFQCPAESLPANQGQEIIVRANGRTTWSFGTFSTEMVN